MPPLPERVRLPKWTEKASAIILNSLNFYRVHLVVFTVVPFFFSGVMYGINTEYHISYIDCLFCCMSAMTVTGLATINLSTLSVMQQVILFWQMIIGSLSFVSIIMIAVRQHFFRQKFRHVIRERQGGGFSLSKTITRVATSGPRTLRRRFSTVVRSSTGRSKETKGANGFVPDEHESPNSSTEMKPIDKAQQKPPPLKLPKKEKHKRYRRDITKDMIKRVEGGGVGMMNPMGWYDSEHQERRTSDPQSQPQLHERRASSPRMRSAIPTPQVMIAQDPTPGPSPESSSEQLPQTADEQSSLEDGPELPSAALTDSPTEMPAELQPSAPLKIPYAGRQLGDDAFPRSRTIAFDDQDDGFDHDHVAVGMSSAREGGFFPRTATNRSVEAGMFPRTGTVSNFPRTYSLRPTQSRRPETKLSGFGGFPTPFQIVRSGVERLLPQATRTLTKTMTMPRTNTLTGRGSVSGDATSKEVPYITFDATVGRNSHFTGLTEEQMDELGGVEFRALRVLFWVVTIYFIFVQLAAFVIIAPYIAAGGRYESVFREQYRYVSIPWFALFQSTSAYSNTGMSLVDLSMVPFQKAYLMVVVLIILILAGNTAFPIFLRLTVWTVYKLTPGTSRISESLKFLLDHPRRCFVYLFPSTQTWVLSIVMLSLTLIDWVSFLVLDIGTPAIASIPIGTRIANGFLQSAAVRSAGFAIVPLSQLAPAVKVLYVIMMYVSVYPIALSVRSTNVYEEKSLGLFNEEDDETEMEMKEEGAQAVAKYVGWHARRQLAFDIWWLGFALWLVCIIERGQLSDTNNATWFTIFNVIFELVSAYGTVGLSLGVPYDNYSFSGSFKVLSKLVVIVVMLRGRHRGLPVAIDRAVMLPKDFTAAEEQAFDEERSRRVSRRASSLAEDLAFGLPSGPSHVRRASRGSFSTAEPVLQPIHGATRRPSDQSASPVRAPRTSISLPNPGSHGFSPEETPPLESASTLGLSFALPRASAERERERGREGPKSPPVTGQRTATLSPVRESTMSRAPTRVAEQF